MENKRKKGRIRLKILNLFTMDNNKIILIVVAVVLVIGIVFAVTMMDPVEEEIDFVPEDEALEDPELEDPELEEDPVEGPFEDIEDLELEEDLE